MTPAVSEEMVERGAAAIKALWAENPTDPVTPMAMSRAALSAALPLLVEGVDEGDLLPCPFCGGKAEILEITEGDEVANVGGSVVTCRQCGASSPVHFDRRENLEDSWNRRAALSTLAPSAEAAQPVAWRVSADINAPAAAWLVYSRKPKVGPEFTVQPLYALSQPQGELREGWTEPKSGVTYTAAQLAALLDHRDKFIVEKGLWSEFAALAGRTAG